ncbi:MAG: rod shape-determining protein MreC [Betaproteobacteria bacterium]|nr:rod shape-determining protein MreC [Betaproteobacteria bacterium]
MTLTAYPVLRARTALEEGVKYSFDFVWNYNTMRRENQQNREVLAKLQVTQAQTEELAVENRRLRSMLNFARSEPRMTLMPARVIENLRGMLTIDLGRAHGIEPRMAVITEDGVVGMVTEVHDFQSSVATMHHRDCGVPAMVYRNRVRAYDGVVKANGTDYNYICTMDFIDMKNEVRKGDILVTNPESQIFPAGLPVGTVSVVHETGGWLWRWAEVEPAVDPYVLDEVFVVKRFLPPEEFFTGSQQQDAYRSATSVAPEVPDDRTFQERFAP